MPLVQLLSVCGSAKVCILQNSQSVQLWQLLLNACYVHSGAVVHVVADYTNSKTAEK